MTEKSIKDALLKQLESKGASLAHFEDLVNDYCDLWKIKKKLIRDIKTRGITYQDVSAAGVMMTKNNPSTKELMGVNRQMLAVLKELGLTTDSVKADDDDAL